MSVRDRAFPALLALLTASTLTGQLVAQEITPADELAPGAVIRFVAPPAFPDLTRGTYVSSDQRLLRLRGMASEDGTAAVLLANLTSLEVRTESRGNTVKGLAIGGGVGLVIGGVGVWALCTFWEGEGTTPCRAEDVLLVTLAVSVASAGLGALMGALIKTEEWKSIPLDLATE